MSDGPHLTTEGISAAFEELLSERDQRAADAHLETCERCQAVLDELIRMRRALHQIGRETPPMPADVQARLEAVLANESRMRQQSGVPAALPVGEPAAHVVPRSKAGDAPGGSRSGRGSHRSKHVAPRGKPHSRKSPRGRRGSSRILAIAAGLVVLAAGSLVTYQAMFAGRSDSELTAKPTQSASRTPNDPDNYYIAAPPPGLTKQTFESEVQAAVKTGKVPATAKRSPGDFGIQGTRPLDCAKKVVRQESHVEPLQIVPTKFEGKPAFLAITRSKAVDSVDAYVVTGCPGSDAAVAPLKRTIAISN